MTSDSSYDPLAPWPTLHERDTGELPEAESFEGVPAHLDPHLRQWVAEVLSEQGHDDRFARRVLSRLRVAWAQQAQTRTQGVRPVSPAQALARLAAGETSIFQLEHPIDRLSVIDAMLGLHPDWEVRDDPWGSEALQRWGNQVVRLQGMLADCGSAWQFDLESRGLARRVDATATEAWREVRQLAESSGRAGASRHLRQAWHEVYGMHPDPVAAFNAAVKAVEASAVDVIAPNSGATLHSAVRKLRKEKDSWQFVIVHALSEEVGTVDVVIDMLERLLRGETERHTSDPNNRPNNRAEAEAVVHLAVTLVQWFVSGAIKRRETTP